MSTPRALIVTRGPFVSGFLWPIFGIAVGAVMAFGFWASASRWLAGDPIRGTRDYGPVGWSLLLPVCLLFVALGCLAIVDLMRAAGIVARVYARQVGDDLLIGPLGWVLVGRGARLRPGDILTITSSRIGGGGRGGSRYGWADTWTIDCGDSRVSFDAPLPVTALHRAQARERLETLRLKTEP